MKNRISKKKWIVIALSVVIVAAVGIAVFMGMKGGPSAPSQETLQQKVTLTLSTGSIQLDVHETLEIKAEVTGSPVPQIMILPLSVTSTFFFILNVRKIRPTSFDRRLSVFR